ncbi:MAG: aldehyde dehydrogenase family protein, partial [Steroidobacteraceae bacterium]
MSAVAQVVDWQQRSVALALRTQAFIDGKFVAAGNGATFDCISPLDGRVLGKVAACDSADIDAAVAAARRAFDSGAWSRTRPGQRKQVLLKFASLITKNAEELALIETL